MMVVVIMMITIVSIRLKNKTISSKNKYHEDNEGLHTQLVDEKLWWS